MTKPFVPLIAPAKTPVTAVEPAPTRILPADTATQSISTLAGQSAAGNQAATPAPKVTVQRDGERVTQIQVRCTCGQVIDLACEY